MNPVQAHFDSPLRKYSTKDPISPHDEQSPSKIEEYRPGFHDDDKTVRKQSPIGKAIMPLGLEPRDERGDEYAEEQEAKDQRGHEDVKSVSFDSEK
jgi:hypothetical protein